jgi:hypothetical protein
MAIPCLISFTIYEQILVVSSLIQQILQMDCLLGWLQTKLIATFALINPWFKSTMNWFKFSWSTLIVASF